MNVDRRLSDGSRMEEETVNKSQIYVTTAGWKNSFAYEKLIELLIRQIIYPDEAIVMGGTWRIPVMEKLLKKSLQKSLNQMEPIMMHHLVVSMNQNGQEMQKMHFSRQKNLTNIDSYYNLNMSFQAELLKMAIMYQELTQVDLNVQLKFVYLK